MEQVARLRAADAAIKQATSAYAPTLSFTGSRGYQRGTAFDDQLPLQYGGGDYWNAQLNLSWTLFDGFRRENKVAQAKADKRRALAQIDASRDQIADEVWTAYSNATTALEQQKAAAALLDASQTSYSSALESYKDGVRNLIDVVSAQRALAQRAPLRSPLARNFLRSSPTSHFGRETYCVREAQVRRRRFTIRRLLRVSHE